VAKKKKGARAGASKTAKKRAAPRSRKQAATAKAPAVHRGLSRPGKVNFKYLKKDIDDHLDRLRGMDQNDKRVIDATAALDQARTALKSPCSPTMVIP
jgi:hypothetical protein